MRVGVSRTPVREALRRLAAEGIVEFLPNRGAHVASWTARELQEIFELRSLLEGHAAARAATRIDAEALDRLDELAGEMESRLDEPLQEASFEISKLNSEFHSMILEASGSRHLAIATQGVIQIALIHRTFMRYSSKALARSFSHHRELIDALTARDPGWAQSVMQSHILSASHILTDGIAVDTGTSGVTSGSVTLAGPC